MRAAFALLVISTLLTAASHADTCHWTASGGQTHYADRAHAPPEAVCTSTAPKPKPAPVAPPLSTAEMEYQRQQVIRGLDSPSPELSEASRRLGRALDAQRAAREQQEQIRREFDDLVGSTH